MKESEWEILEQVCNWPYAGEVPPVFVAWLAMVQVAVAERSQALMPTNTREVWAMLYRSRCPYRTLLLATVGCVYSATNDMYCVERDYNNWLGLTNAPRL